MDAYVHLCFTRSHPMAYKAQKDGRLVDVVWLRINPSILKLPDVKITTEVSNKSGVVPINVIDALSQIDHEVIYTRMTWGDPSVKQRLQTAEKYEVLVPIVVSLDYIENANG